MSCSANRNRSLSRVVRVCTLTEPLLPRRKAVWHEEHETHACASAQGLPAHPYVDLIRVHIIVRVHSAPLYQPLAVYCVNQLEGLAFALVASHLMFVKRKEAYALVICLRNQTHADRAAGLFVTPCPRSLPLCVHRLSYIHSEFTN